MSALNKNFKKSLISGAAVSDGALETGAGAGVDGSDKEISAGSALAPDRSAESPSSSMKYAVTFAGQFLQWCASNEITGHVDWPRLVHLADEFAVYENRRRVNPMPFSKALSKLGVEKTWRSVQRHERGIVSFERSRAQHPRTTVYTLPKDAELLVSAEDDPQLTFFD